MLAMSDLVFIALFGMIFISQFPALWSLDWSNLHILSGFYFVIKRRVWTVLGGLWGLTHRSFRIIPDLKKSGAIMAMWRIITHPPDCWYIVFGFMTWYQLMKGLEYGLRSRFIKWFQSTNLIFILRSRSTFILWLWCATWFKLNIISQMEIQENLMFIISKTLNIISLLLWKISIAFYVGVNGLQWPRWNRVLSIKGIGGSKVGRQGRAPPPLGWHPPFAVGAPPPLWEILDPPLKGEKLGKPQQGQGAVLLSPLIMYPISFKGNARKHDEMSHRRE